MLNTLASVRVWSECASICCRKQIGLAVPKLNLVYRKNYIFFLFFSHKIPKKKLVENMFIYWSFQKILWNGYINLESFDSHTDNLCDNKPTYDLYKFTSLQLLIDFMLTSARLKFYNNILICQIMQHLRHVLIGFPIYKII